MSDGSRLVHRRPDGDPVGLVAGLSKAALLFVSFWSFNVLFVGLSVVLSLIDILFVMLKLTLT